MNIFLDKLWKWALKDYFLIYDSYEVTDNNNRIIKDESWFDYNGRQVQLHKQSFGPSFTNEEGMVEIIDDVVQFFKIKSVK